MSGLKRGGFTVPNQIDTSRFQPKPKPDVAPVPAPAAGVKTKKAPAARPAEPAARELEAIATAQGYTPRGGAKVDGRTLRRTGRSTQLNVRVEPDVKDDILAIAAEQGIAVGELLKTWRDQAKRGGG